MPFLSLARRKWRLYHCICHTHIESGNHPIAFFNLPLWRWFAVRHEVRPKIIVYCSKVFYIPLYAFHLVRIFLVTYISNLIEFSNGWILLQSSSYAFYDFLKVYILYVQLDVKEPCLYYFQSILLYVENLPNLVHPWLVCRAILPLHYVHLYVLHYQYQRNVKLHFLL